MRCGLHHGGVARDRSSLHLLRVLQDRPSQGRLPEPPGDRPRP